jgi:hypothetical protein
MSGRFMARSRSRPGFAGGFQAPHEQHSGLAFHRLAPIQLETPAGFSFRFR